jgi:hypothetical protein
LRASGSRPEICGGRHHWRERAVVHEKRQEAVEPRGERVQQPLPQTVQKSREFPSTHTDVIKQNLMQVNCLKLLCVAEHKKRTVDRRSELRICAGKWDMSGCGKVESAWSQKNLSPRRRERGRRKAVRRLVLYTYNISYVMSEGNMTFLLPDPGSRHADDPRALRR